MEATDLENALNDATSSGGSEQSAVSSQQNEVPQMSQEEEKGFHKGALNTLVAERNELVKMVGNVDAIAQAHVQRLKELESNS